VNEYPVFVPLGPERIAGILTVPDDERCLGVWVLMPGQGAPRGTQYHFPLWTEVARRIAERGLASIRMDHLGVGDSTDRREVLAPEPGREQEPIAAARFAMAATGAQAVGFAGHCYGARLALEAAMEMPECAGVIAAHFAPPVDVDQVPAGRRLRHRIRMWPPVAKLSTTSFGKRALEPLVTAVFGRSRTIAAVGGPFESGLRELLGRASILFLNGDDEARYHLRLRPFLDRFVPTLPPELSANLESVLTPAKEAGGYMALAAQRIEADILVDRAGGLMGRVSPTRVPTA
jgi:alpha/beta superfamily hydrolase